MASETCVPRPACYERLFGESELSYYFQSRATGVNDMYLHLGFKGPKRLVHLPRVRAVWAILRMRHPLLASRVVMRTYDDVRFVFRPPASPEDALADAESQLEYRHQSKDELIESYLNGPRTLSNERLSYLIVSHAPSVHGQLPTPPSTPGNPADESTVSTEGLASGNRVFDYELFICAAHFIGDGMALHQFGNDFFCLVGGASSQEELDKLVADEWKQRWGRTLPSDIPALPASVDENLGTEENPFRRAAGTIDFQNSLDRQIGGQTFPRKNDPIRHTVVPTTSFGEDVTKAMLKTCKAQGVSISSTIFAICNVAWARMSPREKQELPMMMYAPINIRPYFAKPLNPSYWFLCVGYFNIVLPNFLPASCDVSETFWLRARKAKEQSSRFANSPMIVPRMREMAIKRGKQSRVWAKEDDDKAAGVWVPPPPTSDKAVAPRHPSVALLGLSLLGNLDGIYKHANFPDIKLHTLTTGSRQRHSAMLMFAYTFAGKLWISLGYDENGFDRETVDLFWRNVDAAVREFLI
ncbi:hypothetical protein F5148DRAFT_973486 [Russula earlei]|uniref:Uncharacterized protein n=1 Tax=Russula earlei TaxID=71964 RepID=A0ACC0UN65_9AGAM|nr:hypothetical protein F5148DRAFT_973486 [Russula earlei]